MSAHVLEPAIREVLETDGFQDLDSVRQLSDSIVRGSVPTALLLDVERNFRSASSAVEDRSHSAPRLIGDR